MSSKAPVPKQNNAAVAAAVRQELYSGPIPHPDILAGYNSIDPTFAERVFKMAEHHAKTEDDVLLRNSESNRKAVTRGQWLSFSVCIIGVGACVLLSYWRMPVSSAIAGIAAIVQGVASSFDRKNN